MNENEILAKVGEAFRVRVEDIQSHKRTQHIAFVRQVVMYLVRHHTDLSYPAIGKLLKHDHSSCIHGHNLIERRMEHEREFERTIRTLEIGMEPRHIVAWEDRNDFDKGCLA